MPDIEKLVEKAEKYLQKQRFDAAFSAYQEVYKFDPQNSDVLLTLGDLALKLNRPSDAERYYGILVEFYVRRNDAVRAISACRKVLKITPQDAGVQMKLALMLEKTQKTGEAAEAFRAALALYRRNQAAAPMLECLEHIARLEPGDLEAQVALAEESARQGQPKIAAPAFLQAAKLARAQNANERWADLAERAYALEPSSETASLAAAEVRIQKQRYTEAASLLKPLIEAKPDDPEVLRLLASASLGSKEYAQAEPVCWKVFRAQPEAGDLLQELVSGYLSIGETEKALAVAGELKSSMMQQGKRSEFLKLIEEIYERDESNLAVLEMLSELYNEMNREDPLRRSLARLFSLNLAAEHYDRAAEIFERILDVDPYGSGHRDRLLNLEGHIDGTWYKNIADRVEPFAGVRSEQGADAPGAAASPKQTALEELIVEAEMFYRYQLSARLKDTLEKIDELYPGAQERNPRLQQLYDTAGYVPKHAPPPTAKTADPAAPKPAQAARPTETTQTIEELSRISSITANIYREGTAEGVMQAAMNELGRALRANRCWGALGTPGLPPVLFAEYCDASTQPAHAPALFRIFGALMKQAASRRDGWLIDDVNLEPALSTVAGEIEKIDALSLLALPLTDKEEPAGLLLIQQCDSQRRWSQGDVILLRTVAPQIIVAVNNTRLRRLVRSLASTDPETGLLPRGSYVDCLLAEAQRAREQSQPVAVCIIEPENAAGVSKTLGDAGMQKYVQQIGKAISANLRQNDIAIRYTPVSVAVLFPGTALAQGALAVEKLRRVLMDIKPDRMEPAGFCSAICDLHVEPSFDAADGTTEVINRLQAAIEQARKQGGKQIVVSPFEE